MLDDLRAILKPSYLDKPDDEQMYQTYMEVVKASMDQERQANDCDTKKVGEWRIQKEAAAIPVGKHCVRSLYTFFDKEKNQLRQASLKAEKDMREINQKHVAERRALIEEAEAERAREQVAQAERRIDKKIREKVAIDKARDKYSMGSVPCEIKSNTEELKARGKKYDIRLKKTMIRMFARQDEEL